MTLKTHMVTFPRVMALVLVGVALFHASPGQILAVVAAGDALALVYLVVETVAVARPSEGG